MILALKGVSASYRKKTIWENLSFSVESGSITALIGRNGAGKSTLIRCLTGEKQDYQGEILFCGKDLRALSPQERALRLSCLPQTLPQPHVTVRDLVSFGRTPYTPLSGKLSPSDTEIIDWAIRAVGMHQHTSAFVDTLSGGERKKAFFAMTLAQDTPLVLLDEPTAHLDTVSRFEFLALLNQLQRQTGKTFLVVMHDLPEVFRYAHRVVVLHEHKLAFTGTPEACLAADIPERCFQVRLCGDSLHGYAVSPL